MKLIASLRALIGVAARKPERRIEPALEPAAKPVHQGMDEPPERIEPICALPSRNTALIERVQWHVSP